MAERCFFSLYHCQFVTHTETVFPPGLGEGGGIEGTYIASLHYCPVLHERGCCAPFPPLGKYCESKASTVEQINLQRTLLLVSDIHCHNTHCDVYIYIYSNWSCRSLKLMRRRRALCTVSLSIGQEKMVPLSNRCAVH